MTNDMNKIADKIQKLLSLAGNNPSEAEAQAALLKAQKLIAQYNIDMAKFSGEEKIEYTLEISKVKANPRDNQLNIILANSFACKAIIHSGKLSFFGRKDNAQAAKSAMEFIHKTLEAGIRRVCKEHGMSSSQRGAAAIYNAYSLGFIHGLKEAMDAQTKALAIVVTQDVKDAFAKKFPVLGSYHGKGMRYRPDQRIYDEGHRDGHSAMDRRSLEA